MLKSSAARHVTRLELYHLEKNYRCTAKIHMLLILTTDMDSRWNRSELFVQGRRMGVITTRRLEVGEKFGPVPSTLTLAEPTLLIGHRTCDTLPDIHTVKVSCM